MMRLLPVPASSPAVSVFSWQLLTGYAIGLLALAGCEQASGRPLPKGIVSGKVTVAGKPLTKGRVNFLAGKEGFGASGEIKADGAYELEGAIPAGDYAVFISLEISPAALKSGGADLLKSVPQKYQAAKTSGLKAKVVDGKNDLPFALE